MADLLKDPELRRPVRRLNPHAWGVTGGLVIGLGLLFATGVLILLGAPPGEEVGPNLASLGYFFPGYSVTWPGALVGFVYGLASGYLIGRSVGSLYNKLVEDFPS